MKALLSFWRATETLERKRQADEIWALTKNSLKAFREAGEALEYGKTYNQLTPSAAFQNSLEWDFEISKKTMGEVVEYGEQSIKLLSTTGIFPPDVELDFPRKGLNSACPDEGSRALTAAWK